MSLSLTTPAGDTLELQGDGSLRLPARRLLLVADLHLGKAEAFQRAGIAVPSLGSGVLRRLAARCREHGDRPVILGDLIHAESSLDGGLARDLADWAAEVRSGSPRGLAPLLVRGNHDRLPAERWRELGLELAMEPLVLGGLRLTHDAPWILEPEPEPRDHDDPHGGFTLAGHLHPVAVLRRRGERVRVPVFVHTRRGLVLPALGPFTGGFRVDANLSVEARLYAAAGSRVYELPG